MVWYWKDGMSRQLNYHQGWYLSRKQNKVLLFFHWNLVTNSSDLFNSITFFACVLYLLWEAMLISYLSIRTITLPFNDIEELMLKTDFKIFVRPYSAQMDSLRYSSVPILQRAFTERVEPNLQFYVDFLDLAGKVFLYSQWLIINEIIINNSFCR